MDDSIYDIRASIGSSHITSALYQKLHNFYERSSAHKSDHLDLWILDKKYTSMNLWKKWHKMKVDRWLWDRVPRRVHDFGDMTSFMKNFWASVTTDEVPSVSANSAIIFIRIIIFGLMKIILNFSDEDLKDYFFEDWGSIWLDESIQFFLLI